MARGAMRLSWQPPFSMRKVWPAAVGRWCQPICSTWARRNDGTVLRCAAGLAGLVAGGAAACSTTAEAKEAGALQPGDDCVVICEAVCRAGKEMDTAQTVQLHAGTAVQVVDVAQVGPRKRVCVKAEGMKGWLSEVSGSGVKLLTRPVPPAAGLPPSATIRMYSMPNRCIWCTRAKELLTAKGWSALVEVIDVTASEQAYKDMNSRTGKSSVPQIFLIWKGQQPVEEYIGGYDVLAEWDKRGVLDEKLRLAVEGAAPPKKSGWW